jgi:hypothetical protein
VLALHIDRPALQVLILPRPLPKAFNAVEPFAASYTSCNDLLA